MVPSGATWADLIAEHTPEDLLNALKERSGTEGPGFAPWYVRWLIDPHSVQNILKRQRIRRWLDAGKIILLQETHWETSDLAVWENLFPAATIIASEAANGAGGVAILVPPSVEVSHRRIIVPGCAVIADLRFREQPIRVLSWYLPPGRRHEILPLISQTMPSHGPPLFAGGDLNYNVPAPTAEEHDRAQLVRGFLAQGSSVCVEFPGPTHRPTEQSERTTRQLDAFAVPATAIWKWAVTPCWIDGQSDHAAVIASLHRRRTADYGVLSAHLVKNLPPVALADLRSRFGLLERLFGIPRRPCEPGLLLGAYDRPRGPGDPPEDSIHEVPAEANIGSHASVGSTQNQYNLHSNALPSNDWDDDQSPPAPRVVKSWACCPGSHDTRLGAHMEATQAGFIGGSPSRYRTGRHGHQAIRRSSRLAAGTGMARRVVSGQGSEKMDVGLGARASARKGFKWTPWGAKLYGDTLCKQHTFDGVAIRHDNSGRIGNEGIRIGIPERTFPTNRRVGNRDEISTSFHSSHRPYPGLIGQ